MVATTQFAYRTQREIGIIEATPSYRPLQERSGLQDNARCAAYSPCGRYFAWALSERVTIIFTSNGQLAAELAAPNVFDLKFSPLGTFIMSWQRPVRDDDGRHALNLKIWETLGNKTGITQSEDCAVGRYVQKSGSSWSLQYTEDEQFCARMVANEVQIFNSGNLSSPWSRLRVDGVTEMTLSSGKENIVAVFIPERKGYPAAVKLFRISDFEYPLAQKTFFKGDKVQMKWNAEGSNLIVLAQTEVDRSGKSYYGETTLYLMSTSGDIDSRIDLDKEGPIHDVTWSPNAKEFAVVYGYMPAKTTIFNCNAMIVHSFALAPRNTVLYSPSNKYVLIAGFGNLAGQMDIYDVTAKYHKICTVEASNASVCEWSPDGQHILTATTSPRLRVDNGVRIWHVTGGLMYNQDLQDLYQIYWRPQPMPIYPEGISSLIAPSPHTSALTYMGKFKTPTKPAGAYRPPGARGQSTPLAFRREDEGGMAHTDGGMRVHNSRNSRSERPAVPGAAPLDMTMNNVTAMTTNGPDEEPLSKAATKNKKKREAKKLKDGIGKPAEKFSGLDHRDLVPESSSHAVASQGDGGTESSHKCTDAPHLSLQNGRAGLEPVIPETQNSDLSPDATAQDKKIRALLKKTRAIDDLKMRRARGEKLEGTQIRKMDTEDAVREELSALGWQD